VEKILQDYKKPAISVVGLGYVGLATALCFADAGYEVLGVDIDPEKIRMIASGRSPIHEVGIESLLSGSLKDGHFSVSSDVKDAITRTDITFVTVGTPSQPDGDIDLSFISSAAAEIGTALGAKKEYHLVVVKSTVVPTSTTFSILPILETSSGKKVPVDFGLCFSPEFLREGTAIEDTMNPDALIIGSEDDRSSGVLSRLYEAFYRGKLPYTLVTSTSNAEFVKYSVNAFRATQLSFLNSLANLCEKIPGADVGEVTKGLRAVTKIDERYLKSGLGFGGSCLPKDLRALISTFQKTGLNPELLTATLVVNNAQPRRAIEVSREFLGEIRDKQFALLGLSFKPGTDDIRESVAISLAVALVSSGARVRVYDPRAMSNARHVLGNSVEYAQTAISCLQHADCCILATGWDEFKKITPSGFKQLMRNPLIIDGCRLFDAPVFETTREVSFYQLGKNHNDARQPEFQVVPAKNYG